VKGAERGGKRKRENKERKGKEKGKKVRPPIHISC